MAQSTSSIAQSKWQVESGSQITFKIKNAGLNVNGSFGGLKADIIFSPEALDKSSINAQVDASSVDTGIKARDQHLRRSDYFYVSKYPEIRMKSLGFRKKGDDFLGEFELQIREVKKKVNVPFQFIQKGDKAQFIGSFSIKRRDYNVGGWSLILGNEADLELNIKVKKK